MYKNAIYNYKLIAKKYYRIIPYISQIVFNKSKNIVFIFCVNSVQNLNIDNSKLILFWF
jgi:hypothetical protein